MPFTKRALSFFRGLARHNEKPWFEAHRDEYETEVRQPMRELIEDLDARFAEFAPEVAVMLHDFPKPDDAGLVAPIEEMAPRDFFHLRPAPA